ncbi:hypothetical protein CYMTET_9207 [Cymbomonas tetramitiformis]|uniref:non-specific protein-tyrosine kinase n=1 Tax=Cymbomonas tetramitiformis TaxID=36881 RepID=A0AAE0GS85_9CHLO|nr:hypothetical protein CYMTET_9207 [Cymbomonas tetramitiformis]
MATAITASVLPSEWLISQRLDKFLESLENLGVFTTQDFKEVYEDDLTEIGMPPLQRRRFLAAAEKIPEPPPVQRAGNSAKELLARVDHLATLPNATSEASYDAVAISTAAEEVVQAASSMSKLALDPKQWLEDYRLDLFQVNFEGLGVRDIVDFTEVLDQDLVAMAMPRIQIRRFRLHAADIPPAGGSSYRLDLYAAECAAAVETSLGCHEWLRCLRLLGFESKFTTLGVRELRDYREFKEEDLVAMGMPLLQRRRFLMSASIAVPHLPESAEAAIAQAQNKSVVCSTPPQWLEALRLVPWIPEFDALGTVEIVDFKEILRSDLEASGTATWSPVLFHNPVRGSAMLKLCDDAGVKERLRVEGVTSGVR